MTTIFAIFTAIANIKALAGYCAEFGKLVAFWYIENHTENTKKEIADAAACAARAKTKEERNAALDMWRSALSRTRFIN